MNKLEKEILDIINKSSEEKYGHTFKSLKDTCANPEPPYTMRVTPLVYSYLYLHDISDANHSVTNELWTEERIDYLIKHSPMHYMYPSSHFNGIHENGYYNPLLIAIDKFYTLNLTDEQLNHMIKNSDLQVNQNEGAPALILALYNSMCQQDFKLSDENFELLKKSAVNFDEKYINGLEARYNNHNDDYTICFPELANQLKEITREQHIIATKEHLESSLTIKDIKSKKQKL